MTILQTHLTLWVDEVLNSGRNVGGGPALIELCIHVANVFYLVSFLARDMLWLRLLTCCGLVLGIVFFCCQNTPMYGPVVSWYIAFLFINLYQIRRLVIERRLLRLSEKQRQVSEAAFEELSREELLNLLTRAMTDNSVRAKHIGQQSAILSSEERVLREIAFSRLSRAEILNLLTRRMWTSLRRLNPVRWRRAKSEVAAPSISDTAT